MSALNKIESNSFAAACYDNNTAEELQEMLAEAASAAADCHDWQITPEQRIEQIKLAIAALEEKDADAE